MKKLIYTLFILTSTFVHAGLYQCTSADGEPQLKNTSSQNISLETTKPYFTEHAQHPQIHNKNQRPFLIYYAIDSKEPFMQFSVKYEIAKLKASCEKSDKVNFVGLINSLYVESNEIIVCKDKIFKKVNLDTYKSVSDLLKAKRNFLREGDHTGELPGMMTYLVRYKNVVNEAFYDYPLAHPDFLYDLITLVTRESSLFLPSKFMPFLNLKSHGSRNNVLSGLHKCQVDAKTRSQNEFLKKLSSSELQLLDQDDYSSDLETIEKTLSKIGLGESIAVGGKNSLGDHFMGDHFMGENFMGENFMSQTIAGLGNSEALGADFSFGTYHIALSSVLIHLFNDRNERFLGFAMLESCDTNRNISFHQESLELVLGVYSAKHSLWYRNLNWWGILEEANGSTLEMVKLLQKYTPLIKNIVVTE